MNDVSVILEAIRKSDDGFLSEVKVLNTTINLLNTNVEKLSLSVDHQSESHGDLKIVVDDLKNELSSVSKEVDELKLYGKIRHNKNKWWSDNWAKIITVSCIAISAISFVVIAYAKLENSVTIRDASNNLNNSNVTRHSSE